MENNNNSSQKFFLYARKSIDVEDKQVLSIEAQIVELRAFAKQNNLSIAESFVEKQSAKIPGRPIFGEMLARIEKGETFIWIKRKISPEKAEQVRRLGLSEITIQEENKRYYPLGRLAAHVLGGVNIDDEGASGVELQYDAKLKGVAGEGLFLRDAKKRHYHREVLKPPTPGQDLILTIDETIQYIAETELEKAIASTGAEWGTVIIADPKTGEILAIANRPVYDPNDYPPSVTGEGVNRAIQHTFEPGSTFKIITAAAAIPTPQIPTKCTCFIILFWGLTP